MRLANFVSVSYSRSVTQTWKSPFVQQIKGLDIPKLAKNLVQRRVSFSVAETRVCELILRNPGIPAAVVDSATFRIRRWKTRMYRSCPRVVMRGLSLLWRSFVIRFGSLSHVHSASEKWISHVLHRKFGNIVHGHFVVNSTVKLKRPFNFTW
jgi:hypothetical protein